MPSVCRLRRSGKWSVFPSLRGINWRPVKSREARWVENSFDFHAFVSFTIAFSMALHFFPENSLTHALIHSALWLRNIINREEFPGGLVVRIQCFHCCGPGPISGWETDPTNCTVGQDFFLIKKFRLKKKKRQQKRHLMPVPKEPPTSSQPLQTQLFRETRSRYFGQAKGQGGDWPCLAHTPCRPFAWCFIYIFPHFNTSNHSVDKFHHVFRWES